MRRASAAASRAGSVAQSRCATAAIAPCSRAADRDIPQPVTLSVPESRPDFRLSPPARRPPLGCPARHQETLDERFRRPHCPAISENPRRCRPSRPVRANRSEEHTSELQSLMRISYAVFCLKKKKQEVRLTKMFVVARVIIKNKNKAEQN